MRKKVMSLAAGVVITMCTLMGVTPANAATPVAQACVGKSVSAFSTMFTRAGWAYRDFAQDPDDRPGLGDALQSMQVGSVSDDDFPNVCNG